MVVQMKECPCCGEIKEVSIHRRLTQYCEERSEDNYIECCLDCKKEDDAHWKEMWAEYYNSQGYGGFL